MQVPIINGVYMTPAADLRISYPVNMTPVAEQTGVSNGYLRLAEGIRTFGASVGPDRGAIVWNGECYRVSGQKLIKVLEDGDIEILGDVAGSDSEPVRFTYSFDRLAIASGGRLWYYFGGTLYQVVDPDIGDVLDVAWIDGYFMTTDGEFLVVTELNDPFAVNPLKYGSAEADPDPVEAILRLRNEIYAVNRNTIEVFSNTGGEGFPFAPVRGAQIQRGAVGPKAACVFAERIALLGSARNEQPSIYIAEGAQTTKISTREIDKLLSEYSELDLSKVVLEGIERDGHQHLYIHLPDRTAVYDLLASQQLGQPVWFYLTSTDAGFAQYTARYFVWCFNKWICGDPSDVWRFGYLSPDSGTHWGIKVRWEFQTGIVYNEGRGAIFGEMELFALVRPESVGDRPMISTCYSLDGMTWSQPRTISAGTIGSNKRIVWFNNGMMRDVRIQRFFGDAESRIAFARLDIDLQPLEY